MGSSYRQRPPQIVCASLAPASSFRVLRGKYSVSIGNASVAFSSLSKGGDAYKPQLLKGMLYLLCRVIQCPYPALLVTDTQVSLRSGGDCRGSKIQRVQVKASDFSNYILPQAPALVRHRSSRVGCKPNLSTCWHLNLGLVSCDQIPDILFGPR